LIKIRTIFLSLLCLLLFAQPLHAETVKKPALKNVKNFFKKRSVDIFPVPVFDTRPDEGNTYGLMPVMILSDENKAIKTIFGLIGQYNSITKTSGAALAYFYPEADEEISFYGQWAQKFYREATLRFFNPTFLKHYYIDANFSALQTPFGRFFGLGANQNHSAQSNFTSRNFTFDITGGYYLLSHLRANLTARFHSTDLKGRAITSVADTLTRYASLSNVTDSTNFIPGVSLAFDNRPEREYSTTGSYTNLGFLFSNQALGSDKNFQGWNLEATQLIPTINNRLTSALRFHFEEIFGGNIPFYEMSSLGGDKELRAFVPMRFVDHGKMIFQLEERAKVLKVKVLGNPIEIYFDPFFEVGRVFNSLSTMGFTQWQAVGGGGLRIFVPPNVIARIDGAYGSDGFEVYTELGYPF